MTQKVGGIEFDIDVDASGVNSANAKVQSDLKNVESSFKKIDAAADATGASMAAAGNRGAKGMANLRHAAGQVGFQVQDMAVQLQMGTNALVVLGQQGSQIAGIFGPTGAIVGGVLAVGAAIASVMVPSMMSAGDKTEDLTEKLKELSKTNELTINQQKFLKQVEAEEAKQKAEKIAKLKEERKELLSNTETGNWYQKAILGASAANVGFVSFVANKMIPTLTDEQKELVRVNAQLDELEGKTGGKKFDAEANKEAILSYRDRIVAIQSAMDQESAIVTNSLKYRAGVEAGIFSEQEAALKERQENQIVNEKVAFANKLQMLNEQRESLLENEALTETQRQELMSQFNVMEAQARYTHQQKLTDIEEDASEARKNIMEKEKQAKLQALGSTFSALSSLMNTESRKLFEIGKAASVASAIVNTYDAIQTARASAPPPLNYALAAAEAVAGAANVAGIMRTNFGSKSAGQSFQQGRLTTNTSQQQQQPQQRNVSIALTGSSFTGGDIRTLIGQINEELGDGVTLGVNGG